MKKIQPNQKVIDLAKSYGFNSAEYVADWRGFNIFTPTMKDGEIPRIGQPVFILSKGDETRIATEKEWSQFIAYLPEI